jgi:hypothetical protein
LNLYQIEDNSNNLRESSVANNELDEGAAAGIVAARISES